MMRMYRIKSWITQRALDLVVYLNRDSNYISHTRREVPDWFAEGERDCCIAGRPVSPRALGRQYQFRGAILQRDGDVQAMEPADRRGQRVERDR